MCWGRTISCWSGPAPEACVEGARFAQAAGWGRLDREPPHKPRSPERIGASQGGFMRQVLGAQRRRGGARRAKSTELNHDRATNSPQAGGPPAQAGFGAHAMRLEPGMRVAGRGLRGLEIVMIHRASSRERAVNLVAVLRLVPHARRRLRGLRRPRTGAAQSPVHPQPEAP